MNTREFIGQAIVFQLGLAAIAVFVGLNFGFYDPGQPLSDLRWDPVLRAAFVWGIVGTIPMLSILVIDSYCPIGPFRHVRQVVEEKLYPILKDLSIWQMILVSVLAGSTEEILFRWCIQGGLASVIPGQANELIAILMASILFGAMHCINFSYAFLTMVTGIYLGWMMYLTGTWLAPAVAHALYDFVAIYFIARWMKLGEFAAPIEIEAAETGN